MVFSTFTSPVGTHKNFAGSEEKGSTVAAASPVGTALAMEGSGHL